MVLGKKCLNLKNALAHHRVPSRVYLEWVAGGGDCPGVTIVSASSWVIGLKSHCLQQPADFLCDPGQVTSPF